MSTTTDATTDTTTDATAATVTVTYTRRETMARLRAAARAADHRGDVVTRRQASDTWAGLATPAEQRRAPAYLTWTGR